MATRRKPARRGGGRGSRRVEHHVFLEQVGKNGPPRVAVLAGDDEWLRDAAIARLRAPKGTHVAEYDGADRDLTVAAFLDEARTMPFLAPRRLIIVRRAERFLQTAADADALAAYIGASAEWSCVCLVVDSLDERRAFAKAAISAKAVIDCSCPDAARAQAWAAQMLRHDHGKKLPPAAGRLLLDLVGPDLGRISPAIEKLALLAADRDEITPDDVAALVGRERGSKPWDLADALVDGKLEASLTALRTILRDGMENPDGSCETAPTAIALRLLPTIYRGLQVTIRARLVADRARGAGHAAAALEKMAPWQRDRAVRRARRLDLPTLRAAWEAVLKAEERLKGGDSATPDEVLFDLAVTLARSVPQASSSPRGRPTSSRPGVRIF